VWKRSKLKTEDILVLANNGFLREKAIDGWNATIGEAYPMVKNPEEISMFARFCERGLALPSSDFFCGLLENYGIKHVDLNQNGIFHTSVFVHFCEAFIGIKPHWVLFQKLFRLKPKPSLDDPRVVSVTGFQMCEDTTAHYLSYKLIDSNQDWKRWWLYVNNHHPRLPKPSGYPTKHQPWWNTEPTVQEGFQLHALLENVATLRAAGLRTEHVAFSFMKRRVEPLMMRIHLNYEYTRRDDPSGSMKKISVMS
jgi:hypothetical protein